MEIESGPTVSAVNPYFFGVVWKIVFEAVLIVDESRVLIRVVAAFTFNHSFSAL